MPDRNHLKDGGSFVILLIMFLTAFIVLVTTYSVYLFIEGTRMNNAADVHVTKSLLLATNRAQGKLYSNTEKDIKDWVIYADKRSGFEIKYPNAYRLQKNGENGHLVTLTKSNLTKNGQDSLSSAVYVSVVDTNDDATLKGEMEKRGLGWNESWQQEEIGGRMGIKTGAIKDSEGKERELVIWQFGGKIFTLEEYHFNEDPTEDKEMFDKIVSEFKFI